MNSTLARFISFIFNPLLLLIFVPFFLLLKTGYTLTTAFLWTGYTFLFLLAMAAFIAYGVKKKIFTDMDVSKRSQRPLLFFVSIILGIIYFIGLIVLQGPQILYVLEVGVMLGTILVSIINIRLKASIHVATMAALIFALAIVYNGYYLLAIFLIPLVAWARLKIHRHTLPETVVGGLVGILLSLCIYALSRLVAH